MILSSEISTWRKCFYDDKNYTVRLSFPENILYMYIGSWSLSLVDIWRHIRELVL